MSSLAKLMVELGMDNNGFTKGLGGASSALKHFGVGVGVVGLAVGAGLLKIGSDADAMNDTITTKTGATGKAFQDLRNTTLDVFKSIPTSMQTAADAVSALSTKTGDTGKVLDELSKSEIELARITGTDLNGNIDASAKLFNSFGIAAKDQVKTLDDFFNVSQKTGVGVDQLMQQVEQFNPTLRQFGLTADQGALLIGKLDKAGLNTNAIMMSLRKSVVPLTKDFGTDLHGGLTKVFNDIKHLGPGAKSTAEAVKYFGAKAGPELAQAIQDGTLSVEDLNAILGDAGDSILDTASKTNDFSENFKIFKNNVEAALIPLGTLVFSGLNLLIPILILGIDAISRFASALGQAFDTGRQVSTIASSFPAVLQPLISVFLTIADSVGDVIRAFGKGGLQGAFDALGPAISQILSSLGALGSQVLNLTLDTAVNIAGWLWDHKGDIWGGIKDLIGWAGDKFDQAIDVALNIGRWAITQATDLYAALKSKIAEWLGITAIGDGTQGPGQNAISLGTLATAVGDWVVSELTSGSLAAKLSTLVNDIVNSKPVSATLSALGIDVASLTSSLTADDIQKYIQGKVDQFGTLKVEAKQWEIILGTDPTVDSDSTGQAKAQKSALARFLTFDPIEWADAKWGINLDPGPDINFPSLRVINDAFQAAVDATIGTFSGKGPHWNLEMDNNPVVEGLVNSKIGDQVYDALAKLGDLKVDWPNPFKLSFATPAIEHFPLIGDIFIIAHNAYVLIGELKEDWPNRWKLSFATPAIDKFPVLGDIKGIALSAYRALGALGISWPNGWSLSFGLPSLGGFPGWNDIFNLVWRGLRAIGDISISWPNSWSIDFPSPGINMPSMGGGVPFIPGLASGGTVSTPLTLVGERGPELVSLPMGSRVYPAGQTAGMLKGGGSGGGDTYNITTTVNVPEGVTDPRSIADYVGAAIARSLSLQGAA